MAEQQNTNRRDLLKLSGMGALGGLALSALTPRKALAQGDEFDISFASWIHGHSMEIEYPDRMVSAVRKGYAVREEHCDETCCFACKFDCDTSITDSGDYACECPGFERDDCFEWRGVQAEKGETHE